MHAVHEDVQSILFISVYLWVRRCQTRMSRAGSSTDGVKDGMRIRSSGQQTNTSLQNNDKKKESQPHRNSRAPKRSRFETKQGSTPLLNDVPRPTTCAVCNKLLLFESEELIQWGMAEVLANHDFKTGLEKKHCDAGGDPCIVGYQEAYFIVCRFHYDIHKEQIQQWRHGKTPKRGFPDPACKRKRPSDGIIEVPE